MISAATHKEASSMTKAINRLLATLWLLLSALSLTATTAVAEPRTNVDYKLGQGDAIRIVVFQNPDLTLDSRVSESGTITYPLIGTVDIGGLSIEAAEKRIAQGLKDGGFVQKPQVNIILIQVRGNQVSVLGQVNRPGRFPLETANNRISDVLAMAGGIAPQGADTIVMTGIREGKPFRREIDFPAIFINNKSEDDVLVAGGDILYIHRAPVFYIYGEAQRSGSYRIERGMTVQQALAQAGGPTLRGTESRIRVNRRMPGGEITKLSLEAHEPVLADDVIYVRESLF
ncbi:polysaccharide export protein EpsE [Ferribacterium limneticum]|uniref:polysaccharide export protein EpsE n=1 Tax=Ferribacterium limneticum TaxID=76259 RepID=UPI001CF9FD9C|nr:polysaccharide export protein EpsE [Ferribacterium limneticum]UCV29990.1 polysaccharide export protein EpsE [Ferribacterium limneticum]UCV33909.1 polysaccharide export protein EpsE [Ferribacterium limneticum]